jgi:hypothetical protein
VVTTFGAPVEAFAKGKVEGSLDDPDGVWMVLAYAVSMKGSDVTLSKEDFEAAAANHQRYPCSPLVIERADTDWWNGCPEWAEPHGHVEELRVGEAEVTEMDGSTRTAATLEGRVTFLDATRAEVKARKWRFVSITLAKGMKDEATGGVGRRAALEPLPHRPPAPHRPRPRPRVAARAPRHAQPHHPRGAARRPRRAAAARAGAAHACAAVPRLPPRPTRCPPPRRPRPP